MEATFKKIYQIGMIVRDVDSCIKHFEEDYGMGPWEVTLMSNDLPFLKDMTIDGKPSDLKIKTAMLKAYGMEIELIQPLSDSAYKKWLDKHGPGIHHVAFALEDGQYKKLLVDTKESTGKEPWIRGQAAGIGMDFAYLDLREELGLIVECDSQHEDKHPGHDFKKTLGNEFNVNMKYEETIKPILKKILQIGIIVRDVDACVKRFEEDYGMGPWKISELSREQPPFKDMTINGEPTDMKIKGAFMQAYGMEIELIEPLTDCKYKEWLDEHGPGIHHIAFVTEGDYEKLLADHKERTGKNPWIRGQAAGIGMDFSYLDLRGELGIVLECYAENKENSPGHNF